MKEIVRIVICLAALSLVSFLVTDIIKELQLISKSLNPAWVAAPILTLFVAKELTYSSYIKDNPKLSPKVFITLRKIFEIVILILSILLIFGAPFVWFGAIEATIRNSG